LTVQGYIIIIIVFILQDPLEVYKKNLILALLMAIVGADRTWLGVLSDRLSTLQTISLQWYPWR